MSGAGRTTVSAESVSYRIGRFARIVSIGFFTSAVGLGLALGTSGDGGWRRVVLYASLGSAVLSAIALFVRVRRASAAAWGTYVALVGIGSVLQAQEPRPDGALIAIAVGTIVSGVGGVFLLVRIGRESKELDRLLFSEATSMAFFVTMTCALSYALLESWIEAPRLSMWFVWTVGMGAWILAAALFKRRYS